MLTGNMKMRKKIHNYYQKILVHNKLKMMTPMQLNLKKKIIFKLKIMMLKLIYKKHHKKLGKSWLEDQIIRETSQRVTHSSLRNICDHLAFLSQIEPKTINEALCDESWILAMQEELNQFQRSIVWTLVHRLYNHLIIGTKWIFRNELGKNGVIVINKARLVAKGYKQEEDTDFDETHALVTRLEV